jgi:hypothetical protein
MVNLAADSWTKYRTFNLKSRKYSSLQKVVYIFSETLPAIFFRRRRIFADFKTEFLKVSRSHAYIPNYR